MYLAMHCQQQKDYYNLVVSSKYQVVRWIFFLLVTYDLRLTTKIWIQTTKTPLQS